MILQLINDRHGLTTLTKSIAENMQVAEAKTWDMSESPGTLPERSPRC
jgi:hypothetical protein